MAKIAIIDDWINPCFMECPEAIQYVPIDGVQIPDKPIEDVQTHGTLIAKILEKYANEYVMLNIVMMSGKDEGRGIDEVKEALELCEKEQVDIICMSFGTNIISEGRKIEEVILRLYEAGVILIAAADNDGFYMIPAAMDQVIGVRADKEGELSPGEYSYNEDNMWNIEITASDDLEVFVRRKRVNPSTSCTVPIIAAAVNNGINMGCRGSEEVLRFIKSGAVKLENKHGEIQKNQNTGVILDLPIVESISLEKEEWLQLFRIMNTNFGIEVIGIDITGNIRDCGFLFAGSKKEAGEYLEFVKLYTMTELIFFVGHITEKELNADIRIEKTTKGYMCMVKETGHCKYEDRLLLVGKFIVDELS